MVEKFVYDALNSRTELNGCVYMERPETTPMRYVVIEKTGQSESNHIRHSVIAIQCYAESLYQAATLSEVVIGIMENILPRQSAIASVKLNNSYNFTRDKEYRYQTVFEVYWYQED